MVGQGGLVLDSSLISIHCAYADDGNSMAIHCDGTAGGDDCTPGCSAPDQSCADLNRNWGCSWPPDRLHDALSEASFTWNEMVVDTASVESRLPETILAFFSVPNGSPGDANQARGNRDLFSAAYGVVRPAVELDLGRTDAPFSLL